MTEVYSMTRPQEASGTRPPSGALPYSLHWLRMNKHFKVACWNGFFWIEMGISALTSPQQMERRGYAYVCACNPPEWT